MNVLVVDNHDSFTYNLVQMLKECNASPVVRLCENFSYSEALNYHKILISPGPGLPSQKLRRIIKKISAHSSILGVCLGHQAAAEVFGGHLKKAARIYHGEAVKTRVVINGYDLYKDLPGEFITGRYHSWVVDNQNLPDTLEITAIDENNEIMGLHHKQLDLHTVQFHPESILTPEGNKIISNWLNM
jgi:anthranilate synthase component II